MTHQLAEAGGSLLVKDAVAPCFCFCNPTCCPLQAFKTQRTGLQPFQGSQPSPGLSALIRLCCTSDDMLGYTSTAPATMTFEAHPVSQMRLLAIKADGAKVLAGKWEGQDVVMKTSSRIAEEVCLVPHLCCSISQKLPLSIWLMLDALSWSQQDICPCPKGSSHNAAIWDHSPGAMQPYIYASRM